MISNYLFLLFANCKALSRTRDYDETECRQQFKAEVQTICSTLQLSNEQDLQELLLKTSPGTANTLLNQHPFLEIFYLINSVDEITAASDGFDELGRFRYSASYQFLHHTEPDRALRLLQTSCSSVTFLKKHFQPATQPSAFFLSHDIDSLYGSTVQDGLWALKKGRADVLLKLLFNAILQRPHWFNIDKIMDLESATGFRSTFYWLVNKGRIDKRQTNSDYSIDSPQLKACLSSVTERGFENGLHKSISTQSLWQEAERLPSEPIGNRYHYLKFKLPEAYDAIEISGMQLDASLGFAEQFGFRNTYTFPFSPYNFKTGEAFRFLEVPLNLMDGTFHRYLKIPVEKTAEQVIGFFERHRQNAVLSVLWHNTFFTNYKYRGYLQEYKKILAYLYESKLTCITQTDLLNHYSWKQN